MGLNDTSIACLKFLKQRGHLNHHRRVIEIGAQQLSDTFLASTAQLEELGRLFGAATPFNLLPAPRNRVSRFTERLRPEAPSARSFYEWLGFDYASVDIDESPHTLALDLNFDSVPAQERKRYDVVTNFGTTEHVANQLNAFEIIHDLTAINGIMIHDLPAQGMMNHGLINYNPKFFWMLARSNGYAWVLMNFASAEHDYDLPANIRDEISRFEDVSGEDPRNTPYRTTDAGLLVVLKKTFDIPFVPPLDVNTGARTNNKDLQRRYWSVFTPDAFSALALPARPDTEPTTDR